MTNRDAPHNHPTERLSDLAFGLLTVSDTRRNENDVSGRRMRELVSAAGHRVFATAIVRDEPADVATQVLAWATDPGCDAIVSSGGTGLSVRDRTVEAVSELFDIRIDGFGELFRRLSFEEIGSRAMLSRATAGVVRGTPVFVLPGSPAAVTLGLTRIILPEVAHVLGELRRQLPRD